jgi:hypothetical protein
MKRLLLMSLLAVGIATPSLAAGIKIIAPYRATQFEGSVMAVRGVAEVRENQQFHGTDVRLRGPNGRIEFIGFIPMENRHEFPHVQGLDGREVVMYGVMEIFQARGATQLLHHDQVQAWPIVPRPRRSA